jgi:NitT/TauT family transport system permease protein
MSATVASSTRGAERGPAAASGVPRFLATTPGRVTVRLALLLALGLAWEYAPVSRPVRFWLSSPSLIAGTLQEWIADGSLWAHLGGTLMVMAQGYATGSAAGIACGLLLGLLPRLRLVVAPFLAALFALPKVALAPLFIILFGVGDLSKVALVGVTVFFLVLNSTTDGVRFVDPDLVDGVRLMGGTRRELVAKVLLPAALPWIFTGMRIAVRYAFTATLLAELIAANRGLGFLIEFNAGNFNATGSYAAIVVLVICSVVMTELLTRIEGRVSRWRG